MTKRKTKHKLNTMDDSKLSLIQEKICYKFKNPMLLRQAFVSPSLTDASQNRIQNYQLLEFVGDAVLGLSVVKNLVSEFCHIDEKGQFVSLAIMTALFPFPL